MSVENLTWVLNNSPYRLGFRLVHIAIADVANDEHDCLVWCSHQTIARKANLSRREVGVAVEQMVTDGYLQLVRRDPGKPSTYRFIKPTCAESATPARTLPPPAQNLPGPTQTAAIAHLIERNEREVTEEPSVPFPADGLRDAIRRGRARSSCADSPVPGVPDGG